VPDSITITTDKAVDFLIDLLNTPSPTGYTDAAIALCEVAFAPLLAKFPGAAAARTTKGALMLHIPGAASAHPLGLTAHVDTLGLLVTEIKKNGRLKVTNLGGVMWGGIEMEGVTVRTRGDERIRGTIVPENASVHVNRSIRSTPRNEDTLEIRLDTRTSSAAETRAHGIEVGDFIFIDPRVETGPAGFIRSRFLDDKLSVACLYAALEALGAAGTVPAQDTEILISNYEEVGHGGAAGWRSDLYELIAIDMAAVGEGQNSDEYHCTICVKDSSGPYHFHTTERLRRIADAHHIDVKTDIYPYYSSDASAYWRSGGTAMTGLVGPGVDTSHSYERTHIDALAATGHLLAAYLRDFAVD
jgi:putative aminopeptidase FrvX